MSSNPISMSEYYRLRRIAVEAIESLRHAAVTHADHDALGAANILHDRLKATDAATLYDRLEVK